MSELVVLSYIHGLIVCVWVGVSVCVHGCVRVCVCVHGCECVRAWVRACTFCPGALALFFMLLPRFAVVFLPNFTPAGSLSVISVVKPPISLGARHKFVLHSFHQLSTPPLSGTIICTQSFLWPLPDFLSLFLSSAFLSILRIVSGLSSHCIPSLAPATSFLLCIPLLSCLFLV